MTERSDAPQYEELFAIVWRHFVDQGCSEQAANAATNSLIAATVAHRSASGTTPNTTKEIP